MVIEKIVVGSYLENCYILSIGSNCIVVDPGDDYLRIDEKINGKNVLAVLITHRHSDHIGALEDIIRKYNPIIYEYKNVQEKNYVIDKFSFDVIYTPGHTNDSVTYYFKSEKVMFTGDFVFENSIGRTDLPTGDYNKMVDSINLLKKYPDDITLYPGHGNYTTIGIEKINNYWFYNINL